MSMVLGFTIGMATWFVIGAIIELFNTRPRHGRHRG